MARITVEDCLDKVPNRFTLVLVAAERAKQLLKGSQPLIDDHKGNKEVVTALREIAAGAVVPDFSAFDENALMHTADDDLPPEPGEERPPEVMVDEHGEQLPEEF